MMKRQKSLSSMLIASMLLTCCILSSQAQNLSQYKKSFKLIEKSKETSCEQATGLQLKFQNTTASSMDFQYAIQDNNGQWQVGTISGIAPNGDTGEILQCESNGRFKWWARPVGKAQELPFPKKNELNK